MLNVHHPALACEDLRRLLSIDLVLSLPIMYQIMFSAALQEVDYLPLL